MRRSPRDGDTATPMLYAAQDSPLLNLPPEIRNMIWELTCCNIDKALVTIKYGPRAIDARPQLTAISHTLERTCRQARAEFVPILAAADPKNAQGLVWPVKNFYLKSYADCDGMETFLDELNVLPDGRKRTLTKQVMLDNKFDFNRYECSMRVHCCLDREFDTTGGYNQNRGVRVRISIHFDPLTFTTYTLEQALGSWLFGEHGWLRGLRWPILEALDNYKQSRWELQQARAEARRLRQEREGDEKMTGKTSAMPSVKRVIRR